MIQAIPVVEQMRALEQLQELDLRIDQLKKNRTALPDALKSLDTSLAKLRAQVDAKTKAMSEVEKVQRQTRAAMDLNQDRLTRSNTKLESVHNTQEFQAVNKELDQLKKLNSSLEEQSKKSETDLEASRKEIADLTSQMTKIQAERDAQASTVSSQTVHLDKEIQTLLQDRDKFVPSVEKKILALYDRVRGARAGLGVVPAVAGRCKGCNMVVPPQLYNEIRKLTAIHSCPSCHRILFVPADPGANA